MSLHSFTDDGKVLNIDYALQPGLKDSESPATLDWRCILCSSLSAVEYIHSRSVLHNDI